MRVLLVEDQSELAGELSLRIGQSGFDVDQVATLRAAESALSACPYSVVLLDRRLPDGDGLSLVPRARKNHPTSLILMLTARDAIDDRIEGLDAGADDYLTKPFSLDELMARIRAGLRRPGKEGVNRIRLGLLSFDPCARTAFVNDAPILFQRRELALLGALLNRAGCVVPREILLGQVYGPDEEIQEHALTALVSRMRQRLAELNAGVDIHTARGVGYLIAATRRGDP
ncbi:response regulator [Methylocystis bryophila]|uniref:Two-component system response regulator n=1 Tax=Methylocystis bryophila TaxID=655015 RepID=A0A1W6N234_9HYPH|nr:response regulator transcription factor [Methylocystis bryophila]ARN83888.1 two-component system response regulator [Methylocystis bryophila]BDV40999.1 DNA-binding response regulator [Methylocystis bryophila]